MSALFKSSAVVKAAAKPSFQLIWPIATCSILSEFILTAHFSFFPEVIRWLYAGLRVIVVSDVHDCGSGSQSDNSVNESPGAAVST